MEELAYEVGQLHENLPQIGEGSFADVYSLGDGRALRISTGDDEGYRAYVETISEIGVQNSYLPKIFSAVSYRLTDEAREITEFYQHYEFFAVVMEELMQPPKRVRIKKNLWGEIVKIEKAPVSKFNQILKSYVCGNLQDALNYLRLEHQELIIFLRLALHHAPNHCAIDLHGGNSMVRGKRFVVTDPIA